MLEAAMRMLQVVFLGLMASVGATTYAKAAVAQKTQTSEPTSPPDTVIREPVGIAYFKFPPRMSLEGGKPVGSWIDAAEKLMAEAELTYVFVQIPIGRLYNNLQGKSSVIQVWIGGPQPAFLRLGVPIAPSIFGEIRMNLYGRQGLQPPDPKTLKNVSLITLTGYRYAGYLEQLKARNAGVKTISTTSHLSAFRMLKAGRAPYVLDYKAPAELAMAKLGISGALSSLVSAGPAGMLVSKQAEQKDLLLDRLQAASRRIVAREQEHGSEP
ncbi:MAG: ABC transporter substrate-binding protein [Kordiimonadaceae bacterium]|nr:ABC transporter substrate-binding protein [Kordiimonadaceae bacterium]